MKEQYLNYLAQGVKPPFSIRESRINSDVIKDESLQIVSDITSILKGEEIPVTLIGSFSALLQMGAIARHERNAHDIDFLVEQPYVAGVGKALRRNGFRFWDENYVHAHVRNLTGGYGRHHNFGASSESYRDAHQFPKWIGFFVAHRDTPGETSFTEKFAISRFKIETVLYGFFDNEPAIHPFVKQRVKDLLNEERLTPDAMQEIIELLRAENVDFWNIVHRDCINQLDIERRKKLPPDFPEEFIEFERTEIYYVGADDYINRQDANIGENTCPVYGLEGSFWRMKAYFPHYLGPRSKYTDMAYVIETSGYLSGDETEKQKRIYEDRQVVQFPVRSFSFTQDRTFDKESLTGSNPLCEPDYWALLLEDVHYI